MFMPDVIDASAGLVVVASAFPMADSSDACDCKLTTSAEIAVSLHMLMISYRISSTWDCESMPPFSMA
jgi:hypothetical protein